MEDFGYLKEEEQSKLSKILHKMFMLGATLLSIACFIYVTVNAYYFVYDEQNNNIETITSPPQPIKVVAEENTDNETTQIVNNSIYEDIFGNSRSSEHKIAKIQLAPQPAFPPKAEKVEIYDTTEEIVNQNKNNNTNIEKPKTTTQNQKIIVYSDQNKEQNQKDLLTKSDANIQKQQQIKGQEQSQNKVKKRAVKVQIAALTSQNAAQDYWKKISNTNSRLFSGLDYFIQKVDLGNRGIFYRLQIGNFPDQTEAEKFCNKYISQTQKNRADCIIVE